jgi:hypothetical protein
MRAAERQDGYFQTSDDLRVHDTTFGDSGSWVA